MLYILKKKKNNKCIIVLDIDKILWYNYIYNNKTRITVVSVVK
nr:MAG TPA: hypothetical protein [Caudoviricetes sp.]